MSKEYKKIEELKECPYCKSKDGYYEKIFYSGSGIYRYSFKKNETLENGDMYDCLTNKTSKYYYCLNCNKKIALNVNGVKNES